jgi:hypothetical protein
MQKKPPIIQKKPKIQKTLHSTIKPPIAHIKNSRKPTRPQHPKPTRDPKYKRNPHQTPKME